MEKEKSHFAVLLTISSPLLLILPDSIPVYSFFCPVQGDPAVFLRPKDKENQIKRALSVMLKHRRS